jgi:hypothetical protein
LKFRVVNSLIGINGAFCLVKEKKKKRDGRRRELLRS